MLDTRFSVSIQIMMSTAFYSQKNELTNSDYLAESLKTNPTFIRKLVGKLVEKNLIQSFRGKGGGIKLAKPANEISLYDIYLASTCDKKVINIHNKPINTACNVSLCIGDVLSDVCQGLEEKIEEHLSSRKLSDMMKKVTNI